MIIDICNSSFEIDSLTGKANAAEKIAKAFEDNKFELYALLIKEAGKSIHDAINEVIEAIFTKSMINKANCSSFHYT